MGGMAELYLAVEQGPHGVSKLVVLKRIRPHLLERRDMQAMLLDEARLGARFNHRNLVEVIDLDQVDGEPYYVMRYVPGADLRTVLELLQDRQEQLPLPLTVFVASELASALHHAHELRDAQGERLGVVHRDVSTSNVRLSLGGGVTLLDFGVAKSRGQSTQTRVGAAKGNAAYMAPEQCYGNAVDRRTDVFALGIVLYEMATMRRLFAASNAADCMVRVCTAPIVPPSAVRPEIPKRLDEIILRALERDPARRFGSAATLRHALEQLAEGHAWSAGGSMLARLMGSLFERPTTPSGPVRPHGSETTPRSERSTEIQPCSYPTEPTDELATLPRVPTVPLAS